MHMPRRTQETMAYIYSLEKRGMKPGLERITELCRLLGDPQKDFKSIVVGGTNGKGSTVSMISSILSESGLKCGSLFSPHIERYNERIIIDAEPISDDDLSDMTGTIKELIDKSDLKPTFFEFATALAFEYFKAKKVDIAVLEIGLGGKLDAVNIASPLISVITNISFDHTDYLGSTLEEIAKEKAGIIKKGIPLLTGEEDPEIREIFSKTALGCSSPMYSAAKDFSFEKKGNRIFDYHGIDKSLKGITISLEGDHQFKNASLAMASCEILKKEYGFKISENKMSDGLKKAKISGRLENFMGAPFEIIMDGAHNEAGSKVLADYLKEKYGPEKLVLMVGILKDKDYTGILSNLKKFSKKIILVKPKIDRSWEIETIDKISRKDPSRFKLIPDIGEAVSYCMKNLNPDDTLCITGSFYTLGEAKKALRLVTGE